MQIGIKERGKSSVSKVSCLKSVGVIGSRTLPYSVSEQVGDVVEDLIFRKYHIASGGAMGTDQFVIERLLRIGLSHHGTVYSAWKDLLGFPKTIRTLMWQFKENGGHVLWGLAYSGQVPALVKASLLLRNQRIVEACYGLVAFIDSNSRGSILTIQKTASKRKPLVVFPFQCDLPSISYVKWVPLRCGGCWEGGFKAVYLK